MRKLKKKTKDRVSNLFRKLRGLNLKLVRSKDMGRKIEF